MTKREYILDDERKIRYWLSDWTNHETDTEYYVAQVSIFEQRRRWLTLGLTKKWKRVESERDERIERDEDAVRERIEELRAVVLGDQMDPLDELLDDILEDIEPNYGAIE